MAPAPASERAVFISYAREDGPRVAGLIDRLREANIPVWFDQHIEPGDRWDQRVSKVIRSSRAVLVVLSEYAVSSQAVSDEFAFALDEGRQVIPVLLEACDVPLRLRQLQWVDATGDVTAAVAALAKRLADLDPAANPTPKRVHKLQLPKRGALTWGIATLLGMGSVLVAAQMLKPDPTLSVNQLRIGGSIQLQADRGLPISEQRQQAFEAADKLGDRLLELYRTQIDDRSQKVGVKSEWYAAAEAFTQAGEQATAPADRADWKTKTAFARGYAALLEGHLNEAESELLFAATSTTLGALPRIELATVYTRLGRYPEAHLQAQKAHALEPDFWLAMACDGSVYSAQGNLNEAIAVFEAVRGRFDLPLIQGNLALAYHAAGMHDQRAEALAKEALQRDANLPSALLVVAERLLERGDAAAALSITQRLVDHELFDARSWLIHGDVLLALDRQDEARRALTHAVDIYETTKQTGLALARIQVVAKALHAGRLPQLRGKATDPIRSSPAAAAAMSVVVPPSERDRNAPPSPAKPARRLYYRF